MTPSRTPSLLITLTGAMAAAWSTGSFPTAAQARRIASVALVATPAAELAAPDMAEDCADQWSRSDVVQSAELNVYRGGLPGPKRGPASFSSVRKDCSSAGAGMCEEALSCNAGMVPVTAQARTSNA